jgi:hypothetical protein
VYAGQWRIAASAGNAVSSVAGDGVIYTSHPTSLGAFRRGVWQTVVLLRLWQELVEGLPGWQVHRHEGYRAITVDVTAFWRPALRSCPSKLRTKFAIIRLPTERFQR